MNFSLKFLVFSLLQLYLITKDNEVHGQLNCTKPSSDAHANNDECPENSKCTAATAANVTTTNFQCICLTDYVWNPLWQQQQQAATNSNNSSSNQSSIQLTTNGNVTTTTSTTAAAYCLSAAMTTGNTTEKTYVRKPPKVEHLAIGILMVLFVAIAATVLLYLLKVSRPIKRTRAAYTKLKRRREQRERLEEYCDGISMIQLDEKR